MAGSSISSLYKYETSFQYILGPTTPFTINFQYCWLWDLNCSFRVIVICFALLASGHFLASLFQDGHYSKSIRPNMWLLLLLCSLLWQCQYMHVLVKNGTCYAATCSDELTCCNAVMRKRHQTLILQSSHAFHKQWERTIHICGCFTCFIRWNSL